MSGFTKTNIKQDVEDAAPKFGMSPGLEFRYARRDLGLEQSGMSYEKIAPDFRQPFGHSHKEQEEIYVLVSGGARIKLDDEVIDLEPFDAVRIGPGVMRCLEGGPEGAELVLFGAPLEDPPDTEMVQDWWSEPAG